MKEVGMIFNAEMVREMLGVLKEVCGHTHRCLGEEMCKGCSIRAAIQKAEGGENE